MAKSTKSPASVEEILEECTKAVTRGLGRKRAGRDAANFWINGSRPKIEEQVRNNVDWEKAKKRVLPTAVKMGKVAAALTGEFAVVPLWAATAATEAVKKDPKCPQEPGGAGRARARGIVLGGFCP